MQPAARVALLGLSTEGITEAITAVLCWHQSMCSTVVVIFVLTVAISLCTGHFIATFVSSTSCPSVRAPLI